MDLQERLQLDAARQHVARVRARARPWRAILALVLALIAAAVSVQAMHTADLLGLPGPHNVNTWLTALGQSGNRILQYGAAVAFFLLAGVATIGLANKSRDVLEPSVGSAHAGIVRFAVLVAGGLATVIVTLQLFSVAITQLVVGGAVTGVLVGIAAQQSLANVFAGIVLLLARPFQVGDQVGIRSGALSGLLEGTVSEISVAYVRLETANGPVHVPNSQVLAAAVGPAGALPNPVTAPPPGPGVSPAGQGVAPADAPSGTAQQGTEAAALPGTAAASHAAEPAGPQGAEPQHEAGRQPG